jgi:competence protein ComGC
VSRLALWVAIGIVLLVAAIVVFVTLVPKIVERSGVIEKQTSFMTQTTVRIVAGQVEIHRLRHGRYPARLSDIEYLGDWERSLFPLVRYYTDSEGSAYYIEPVNIFGRAAGPSLPEGYWQGTGFSEDLMPQPGVQ